MIILRHCTMFLFTFLTACQLLGEQGCSLNYRGIKQHQLLSLALVFLSLVFLCVTTTPFLFLTSPSQGAMTLGSCSHASSPLLLHFTCFSIREQALTLLSLLFLRPFSTLFPSSLLSASFSLVCVPSLFRDGLRGDTHTQTAQPLSHTLDLTRPPESLRAQGSGMCVCAFACVYVMLSVVLALSNNSKHQNKATVISVCP